MTRSPNTAIRRSKCRQRRSRSGTPFKTTRNVRKRRSTAMQHITFTVNGTKVSRDVEDETLLVTFLREYLKLTGTHVGCDTSQCGCCVVHVDGKALKSCTMLAMQADGADVLTIEGLADGEKLHPMQEAFRENHG